MAGLSNNPELEEMEKSLWKQCDDVCKRIKEVEPLCKQFQKYVQLLRDDRASCQKECFGLKRQKEDLEERLNRPHGLQRGESGRGREKTTVREIIKHKSEMDFVSVIKYLEGLENTHVQVTLKLQGTLEELEKTASKSELNITAEVDNNLEGPESAPALEVLKLQEKLKEVSIATRDECMVSLEIVQADQEANLKTMESRCLNINNHERFFRAENFPAQCLSLLDGDRLGINMLESAFDLVVKIEITGTSQDQPTGASRCATGSNVLVFGSGMIQDVYRKSTGSGERCICPDCQRSRKPRTEWAEFGVLTAMGLMQYDPQCKQTVCHLSYKDPRGRQVRSLLKAVYFKDRQGGNDVGYCKLACITHDLTLAEELSKRLSNWKSSRIRAVGRAASGNSEKCVVVSYPHGLKKCVSVGQLLRREHRRDIYDAVTCEGCCGAPVFFFKKGVFTKNTVHVGKNQLRENQSTVEPA